MIGIVSALPREIAGLVRGTKADPELLSHGVHLYQVLGAVAVAAGMGSRVSYAVSAALACGEIDTLISVGLAGACSPEQKAGSVLEASTVVDVHTGERFTTASTTGVVLVTTSSVASVQEKARLREAYGAVMVDMEAARVARLARANGLQFRAVKGISDAHDFELASLERFTGKHGHFRARAFALHTAVRPHRWAKTVHLGRNSNRALQALTAALRLDLKAR